MAGDGCSIVKLPKNDSKVVVVGTCCGASDGDGVDAYAWPRFREWMDDADGGVLVQGVPKGERRTSSGTEQTSWLADTQGSRPRLDVWLFYVECRTIRFCRDANPGRCWQLSFAKDVQSEKCFYEAGVSVYRHRSGKVNKTKTLKLIYKLCVRVLKLEIYLHLLYFGYGE